MTSPEDNSLITTGVVTFLDVLGWKGVWQRKPDALRELKELIEKMRKSMDQEMRGLETVQESAIKSISDTIAIFTRTIESNAIPAIEFYGRVSSVAIVNSILAGLPVRGATSFGEYELDSDMFVGMAVDEAAAWYESTDWIGVHLSPSACFMFETTPESIWENYPPPFKQKLSWKTYCVRWTDQWFPERSVQELKDIFRTMGPLLPEIAGKFTYTLDFVDKIQKLTPPEEQ